MSLALAALAASTRQGCPKPDSPNTDFWEKRRF
jgi:hypothetical protein